MSDTTITTLSPEIAQRVAGELAEALDHLTHVLNMVHDHLPQSANETAMLEGEEPYDLATDLRGSLECLVNDCLSHGVRILREMAEQSEEKLRRGWRRPRQLRHSEA